MSELTFTSEQCRQARLAKDPRFDGRFFTGVHSTGIYCRPVCPVHPPLEKNVRYYANAAAAEHAGLRPCLRCRPELAPSGQDWRAHAPRLTKALQLLRSDPTMSMASLAKQSYVSERQLRRWFIEDVGVSPLQLQLTERLLQAKQLLTDSQMPVTEVALACGFNSVRRFNDAFVSRYRIAPSRFRKEQTPPLEPLTEPSCVLRLPFRPPFDGVSLLRFFTARAVDGIETVTGDSVIKRLSATEQLRMTVSDSALLVTFDGVIPSRLPALRAKVMRMWDLYCDPIAVADQLGQHQAFQPLLQRWPGLRVASYFDEWEALLRSVLGQQITVEGGRKLLSQLVQLHQQQGGFGLPAAAVLAEMDLQPMKMPTSRKQTLQRIASTTMHWQDSDWLDLDSVQQQLLAIKGVGPWTVNYWRLRCGQDPDALPIGDVILRKAAIRAGLAADDKQLLAVSRQWQPWRSYATSLLWQSTIE